MRNPFLNRNFTFIYATVWVIIIIAQFFISTIFFDNTNSLSIIQSIVSNLSFASLGFGIWFVVKYNFNSENKIQSFFILLFSGLAVVMIWLGFLFIIDNLLLKMSSGSINFQFHYLGQFTFGIFYYTILVLVFRTTVLFYKYAEKEASEEKLQKLLTESKLSTLKAYINPHFLFNSLNSVNALITSNPEQAREMLINLSEYFRYSLKQKDNNFINFADELHYTFTYFDIERLRFGERIVLKTDIDENISEIKVPVMILQPLFENIIKHAVAESLVQIIVNFNAKINNGFLEIDLENNYDEESIPTKGTGIGLDTTYERLHLIYQNKDLLNYSKNKGIFKLNLKIPIN